MKNEMYIKDHNIAKLFKVLSANYEKAIILGILKKYLGNDEDLIPPIRNFFSKNKTVVSNYYEALKYPEDKKGIKLFDYSNLKNTGNTGIIFYQEFKGILMG